MATPVRRVAPGYYEICRRCVCRKHMLKSSADLIAAFMSLLAHYGKKYGIRFFVVTLMSNHYHLILQDTLGNFPDFIRDLNAQLAKCINRLNGTRGPVWCSEGYHLMRIVDDESLVRRLQYVSENPLAANLVARMDDYPNLWVRPHDFERDIEVKMPDSLYSEGSKMRKIQTLRFHRPPSFASCSPQAYRDYQQTLLSAAEARHDARRKTKGLSVVGPKKLRRLRWCDEPKPETVPSEGQRLKRAVGVVANCPIRRADAIEALAKFRAHYRRSLSDYRAGIQGTTFPRGTWKMRREHGVEIQTADVPEERRTSDGSPLSAPPARHCPH